MSIEDRDQELEKNLEDLDYNPSEDIFNKEESIPIDGDGNPIIDPNNLADEMPYGLDIPGSEDDDNFEQITSQIPTQDESLHTEDLIENDFDEEEDEEE